jgi:hypothetical protein
MQTSPNSIIHPPHSCNHCSHWSFRTLLQALSDLQSDSGLRYKSCNSLWANSASGPLLLAATCSHVHYPERPPDRGREIFSKRRAANEHSCSSTYTGGNSKIFLCDNSSQILSTASAFRVTVCTSPGRIDLDCFQFWAHCWRHDMAYSAWHGVYRLRSRLEPSS